MNLLTGEKVEVKTLDGWRPGVFRCYVRKEGEDFNRLSIDFDGISQDFRPENVRPVDFKDEDGPEPEPEYDPDFPDSGAHPGVMLEGHKESIVTETIHRDHRDCASLHDLEAWERTAKLCAESVESLRQQRDELADVLGAALTLLHGCASVKDICADDFPSHSVTGRGLAALRKTGRS